MGAYPVLRLFTPREYLKLERASRTKNEYLDGHIYAMAGGTSDHDRIIMNMAVLIGAQMQDSECEVHSSDLRIAVSKTGPYFYPDLSVVCGEDRYLDASRDCVLNPSVLVEVLSKSTRKYDRDVKIARYREMPTVRHILLISQQVVSIEHHLRQTSDQPWEVAMIQDVEEEVALSAVSVSLRLSQIYRKVVVKSIS